MITREEIREGIADTIDQMTETYMSYTEKWTLRDLILKKLHSQGVVIKVEEVSEWGGLILVDWDSENGDNTITIPIKKLTDAGYVAVEPLIKEV